MFLRHLLLGGILLASSSVWGNEDLNQRLAQLRGKFDGHTNRMLSSTPMAKTYSFGAHLLAAVLGAGVDLGLCRATAGDASRSFLTCTVTLKAGMGLGGGVQLGRTQELGRAGMRPGEVIPAITTDRQIFGAIGLGVEARDAGVGTVKGKNTLAAKSLLLGAGLGVSAGRGLRIKIPLWKTGASPASRCITEARSLLEEARTAIDGQQTEQACKLLERIQFLDGRAGELLDPRPAERVAKDDISF